MSEQIQEVRIKTFKLAVKFGFRIGLTLGLGAILVEEFLPEPLAKPIVVITALTTIGYNFWSWRHGIKSILHR